MKVVFYSLFISIVALLVLISFFLGGFLGEMNNIENICGRCRGCTSTSNYQICVGEYIVFECKEGTWIKTFEVEEEGKSLSHFFDF